VYRPASTIYPRHDFPAEPGLSSSRSNSRSSESIVSIKLKMRVRSIQDILLCDKLVNLLMNRVVRTTRRLAYHDIQLLDDCHRAQCGFRFWWRSPTRNENKQPDTVYSSIVTWPPTICTQRVRHGAATGVSCLSRGVLTIIERRSACLPLLRTRNRNRS
jgi:hypothetical protein